jgi:acetoacetate decarboxylase
MCVPQLFDLMTMGFKYQLLSCSHPQEVLLVTLNHLYQLRSKVEGAPAVTDLVDEVIRLVNLKYAAMSCADYASMKHVRSPAQNPQVQLDTQHNLSCPFGRRSADSSATNV